MICDNPGCKRTAAVLLGFAGPTNGSSSYLCPECLQEDYQQMKTSGADIGGLCIMPVGTDAEKAWKANP